MGRRRSASTSVQGHIDPRLGPQDIEIPAERINYRVLAKGGEFFEPGDWRQLDPKTGKTCKVRVGRRVATTVPASVAAELAAEGHRVLKKVHLS